MSKSKHRQCLGKPNYWQNAEINSIAFTSVQMQCQRLATNRFVWSNLPPTCNARFLEQTLFCFGVACFARSEEGEWYTLQVAQTGLPNIYGEIEEWTARSFNSELSIDCNLENGVIAYDNNARMPIWQDIMLKSADIAHIEQTRRVNLAQQRTPYVLTAPQDKELELTNFYKQLAGGETAILGYPELRENIKVDVVNTEVPLIAAELDVARRNVWNEYFMAIGIEHLEFEKKERMIEEEAAGSTHPTSLILSDFYAPRLKAAKEMQERFKQNITVEINYNVLQEMQEQLGEDSVGAEDE